MVVTLLDYSNPMSILGMLPSSDRLDWITLTTRTAFHTNEGHIISYKYSDQIVQFFALRNMDRTALQDKTYFTTSPQTHNIEIPLLLLTTLPLPLFFFRTNYRADYFSRIFAQNLLFVRNCAKGYQRESFQLKYFEEFVQTSKLEVDLLWEEKEGGENGKKKS